MRGCRLLCKISPVPTRDVVPASSLVYRPRYGVSRKMTLSTSFDVVTEKNRFLSLELLLKRLSGHVGRRQYSVRSDLTRLLEPLQQLGIDWHELKFLSREELVELFEQRVQLDHAERALLLTALDAKVCGVLRQSSARHSTNVCMNRGRAAFGWRCGLHGHTNDVYFEGKQRANATALRLSHRSSLRAVTRDGVRADVRSEPDFSVVGRRTVELNPRVWSSPESPNFSVMPIGYEFRVHPDDPRAGKQIEAAAREWDTHVQVVQHVIEEMLETYAVEREPQPLAMAPDEMGPPDSPQAFSSAFTSRVTSPSDGAVDSDEVVVEQRMVNARGVERPWFHPPLVQDYTDDGVPTILPFAPSIIIKSSYRQVVRGSVGQDITAQLMHPVLDIALYVHPGACFWWNAENEERCVEHILDYAKRVPFALPFNLYFRVDSSKQLRIDATLANELSQRMGEKAAWFDAARFRAMRGIGTSSVEDPSS